MARERKSRKGHRGVVFEVQMPSHLTARALCHERRQDEVACLSSVDLLRSEASFFQLFYLMQMVSFFPDDYKT